MSQSAAAQQKVSGVLTQFKAGELIVKENDASRKLFIIKQGRVRVFKNYLNQQITLAILGEGEVFGELSFFDAEPRSASVEAVSDLSAIVIDGVSREIAGLPVWVFSLLKTAFHRFRDVDQKLAVFQSMYDFQKKNFRKEGFGKIIYLELLRYLKAFKIVHAAALATSSSESPDAKVMHKDLEEILGTRSLTFKAFWRTLKEHRFLDVAQLENNNRIVANDDRLDDWRSFLMDECKSERYLIMSHTGVALLGRIVGFTNATLNEATRIAFKDIKLEQMPFFEDGLCELQECKLIQIVEQGMMELVPSAVSRIFVYQSILKNFDPSFAV